jgi:predicted RNA-binding protein with PUA-like domain
MIPRRPLPLQAATNGPSLATIAGIMRERAYEHVQGFWLLKTEPSDYSFDDLERDVSTVWDGVGNNTALKYMREVRENDRALIYHTGSERRIVGVARVLSDAYPDPQQPDSTRVVFDVEMERRLPEPVPLSDVKDDPDFSDWELVTNSRLSVMPVDPTHWEKLLAMGGDQGEGP